MLIINYNFMKVKKLFLIYLQFIISLNLYAINKNFKNFSKKNNFISNNYNFISQEYKKKNIEEDKEEFFDINKNNINSYILNDIYINKSFLSKDEILNILKLKLGNKIYINNIQYNDIINNLWNTGFFDDDIKIKFYRKEKNKVNIKLFIKDLPKISSLNIFGIKKNIFNIISNKHNIKLDSPYSIKYLNKIKEEIIKYYNENGYPNVNVICNIKNIINNNNDLNNNNVRLFISVNKKNKIEIDKIILEGNDNFYKLDFNKKNDNSLISNYIDNGYINTNINSNESSIEKNKVNIDINLVEGKQSILNKIDNSGNYYTGDNTIMQYLNTYIGDIFYRKKIKNTIFSLGKSEIFNPKKISVKIKPSRNNNTVDIKYKFFEKNSNKIKIQAGYSNKNIFGNFSINFNNLSTKNLFNLDKWTPIPQGDGERLSLFSQLGISNKLYGFTFVNPYLFNDRLSSFNLGSSYSINKNIDDYKSKSRLINYNLYLGIDKKIPCKKKNFILTIYGIYDRYHRFDTNIGNFKLPKNGITNDINYNFGLKFYSLNKDLYHTNGLDIDIKSMFTLPYSYVINNINKYEWPEYFRLKTKLYSYHEIFKNFVVKTGGEFGFLGYYSSNIGSSIFKRFYLGGITNLIDRQGREFIPLRGYSEFENLESVTSQEGGEIYSKFLSEIRYSIFRNEKFATWVLGFFESGGILHNFKMIKDFSLKKSLGAGIRLSINTLGIIGFDIGYGFDNSKINHESKFRSHFIIENEI